MAAPTIGIIEAMASKSKQEGRLGAPKIR
ncbi:hypothetical protein BPO_1668 [Bergeyella porcorum]|uniref:Uncharacterized protein n=1 Tax=Bergeyella porcorum TaxID=1735111 RepID=A0AAU0F3N4_9FLAO